uniref:Uncharacterized protein n=1 Tax=Arundo donax TaxID=35708 RepID=A0A0A8YSX6_ARUDO
MVKEMFSLFVLATGLN